MNTTDKINAILKVLGFEIGFEEPLKDHLDSLDKVEFVMMVEKEFVILVTDEEMDGIATVEDVVGLVDKKKDAN